MLRSCNIARRKLSLSRLPVGHEKALCCLYCDFCSSIRLGEADKGYVMPNFPFTKEVLSVGGDELWTAIAGEFFRYAKCGKEGA